MKAMILAAGLGTRLRPLTLKRPKALIPVANRPLIDRTVEYLKFHGVREIVVNAHHHHNQISKHLDQGRPFGIRIEVRVEPEILGTGGGIKNTTDFWDTDPFIVVNGDVLTNIDLIKAYKRHLRKRNPATLVLHDCRPFNKIQIDSHSRIVDIPFENYPKSPGRLAFTGIHVIEPELLSHIPGGAFSNIIDCYRELIRKGTPIGAYVVKGHYWRDIGTVSNYIHASKEALRKDSFLIGRGCKIHDTARLKDWAIIGDGTCLEQGAEIRGSILWEDVKVKKGTKVVNSIVTSSGQVGLDLIDRIL